MEITSFVLGMLTIAAAVLVVAVVVGLVRITSIRRKVNDLSDQIEHLDRVREEQLKNVWGDINMIEHTLRNQIRSIEDVEKRDIENVVQEIDRARSYIDSRIDKIVASGTLESSKKGLIKG